MKRAQDFDGDEPIIDSIVTLSEELCLPQDAVLVFLFKHVPEAQRELILPLNKSQAQYSRVLEDVLHALQLTDEQMLELAKLLNINDETVNEFILATKILERPVAVRFLIELHRFRMRFDCARKLLVYQGANQAEAVYAINLFQKGFQSAHVRARGNLRTLQGMKSYQKMMHAYGNRDNVIDGNKYLENIFFYSYARFSLKCSLSEEDKVKLIAVSAGKDRILHGGFINIMSDESIQKVCHEIFLRQIGDTDYIRKAKRTKTDQKGLLTSEQAKIYAQAYIDAYKNIFWKFVVICNQVILDSSDLSNIRIFSCSLRDPFVVPKELVDAYVKHYRDVNSVEFSKILSVFQHSKNAAEVDGGGYTVAIPWEFLVGKEKERFAVMEQQAVSGAATVLLSFATPVARVDNNNNNNNNNNNGSPTYSG